MRKSKSKSKSKSKATLRRRSFRTRLGNRVKPAKVPLATPTRHGTRQSIQRRSSPVRQMSPAEPIGKKPSAVMVTNDRGRQILSLRFSTPSRVIMLLGISIEALTDRTLSSPGTDFALTRRDHFTGVLSYAFHFHSVASNAITLSESPPGTQWPQSHQLPPTTVAMSIHGGAITPSK